MSVPSFIFELVLLLLKTPCVIASFAARNAFFYGNKLAFKTLPTPTYALCKKIVLFSVVQAPNTFVETFRDPRPPQYHLTRFLIASFLLPILDDLSHLKNDKEHADKPPYTPVNFPYCSYKPCIVINSIINNGFIFAGKLFRFCKRASNIIMYALGTYVMTNLLYSEMNPFAPGTIRLSKIGKLIAAIGYIILQNGVHNNYRNLKILFDRKNAMTTEQFFLHQFARCILPFLIAIQNPVAFLRLCPRGLRESRYRDMNDQHCGSLFDVLAVAYFNNQDFRYSLNHTDPALIQRSLKLCYSDFCPGFFDQPRDERLTKLKQPLINYLTQRAMNKHRLTQAEALRYAPEHLRELCENLKDITFQDPQ
ncbi:hypothetical protein FJ366_03325 [Candidatus Dependentiae bacterium]|nr:hypothetical protein [Candidatus Dependentiae bacterium]